MQSTKHSNFEKHKAIHTLLTNNENEIGDKCVSWGTPDVA